MENANRIVEKKYMPGLYEIMRGRWTPSKSCVPLEFVDEEDC